MDKTEVVELMI